MDDDIIVQGLRKVEERFLDFIFDADGPQRLIDCRLIRPCHEGYGIADKTDLFIQNKPVVRTRFRIGLAGNGKSRLRYVIGRYDTNDARNFLSSTLIDLFNDGSGMGAPQHLYDEAVFGHDVFRIDRLPRNQGLGILLGYDLIDRFKFHHDRTSFPLALKYSLIALI